jgi:hypothetical protein
MGRYSASCELHDCSMTMHGWGEEDVVRDE